MNFELSKYIFFFLLFILPFIVLPFGSSHYETPKVIIAEICIFILVLLKHEDILKSLQVLWKSRRLLHIDRSRLLFLQQHNVLLLFVFFILSLYHLIFNQSDVLFLGNTFRWQGTFLFWLLLAFAAIASSIKPFVLHPLFYAVLIFLHVLMAFSGALNIEGRSVGTLGEPNAYAATAIFLWPWLLQASKPQRFKVTKMGYWILVIVCLILTSFIILLSGSRSGLLAFGLQVCMLIASKFVSLQKIVIGALIVLSAMMFLPFTDRQTVYENRGEIWKTALIAGYEHPITGWGFGNVEVALKEYNTKLYNNLRGYYVDSSHNVFLDWWIQGGIIGICISIIMLYQTMKNFVRIEQIFYLVLLFGLLVVMAFNPVSIVTLVHFWWLIGIGITKTEATLLKS